MKPFILFILSALVLMSSCHPRREEDAQTTQLDQAQAAIKNQDYDSAIRILNPLVAQNPSVENKMLLSSAYAARAGVFVQNYWTFLAGQVFPAEDTAEIQVLKLGDDLNKLPPDLRNQVNNLNKCLSELRKVYVRIQTLPYIDLQHREDIRLGAETLTDIGTRGGHLYRAVLLMILVRAGIEDANQVTRRWEDAQHNPCDPALMELLSWISYGQKILVQLSLDAGRAFPSKEADLSKAREQLQSLQEPLNQVVQAATLARSSACGK